MVILIIVILALIIVILAKTILKHLNKITTMFIIFWDILIVEQIFLSPQVKRNLIISN